MQVLLVLVRHAGKFVGKQALIDDVWEGRAVTDDCITRAIHQLRQALDDDPRAPEFIETRTHVGYRLRRPPRPVYSMPQMAGLAVAGIAALALVVTVVRGLPSSEMADAPQTVAVLPFLHLSQDEAHDHLSLAMTESLTASLAQSTDLQVISRTSVMSPSNRDRDTRQLARLLGADLLVEGSVQAEGETVRVTAQLIDTATDVHLWAGQFDRPIADLLPLQSELSRAITAEVSRATRPPEPPATGSLPTAQLSDYLRDRYRLTLGTVAEVEAALAGFERLTERHPDFAPAHLSRGQALLALFKAHRRDTEALEAAQEAARRFEALAGVSSESRRLLGQATLMADWDFVTAERMYREALALNPSDTVVQRRYAWLLVAQHRYQDAIEQIEQIQLLDPMYYESPDVATLLLYSGRADSAVAEFERLDAITELSAPVLRVMAHAYLENGDADAARETMLRMLSVSGALGPGDAARLADASLAAVYRHGLEARRFRSPIVAAGFEALLGDSEAALASLNAAIEARDPFVLYLDALPELRSLHGDPRFEALLDRIGVSPQHQPLEKDFRLSSAFLRNDQADLRDEP